MIGGCNGCRGHPHLGSRQEPQSDDPGCRRRQHPRESRILPGDHSRLAAFRGDRADGARMLPPGRARTAMKDGPMNKFSPRTMAESLSRTFNELKECRIVEASGLTAAEQEVLNLTR